MFSYQPAVIFNHSLDLAIFVSFLRQPYANRIALHLKARHAHVPVVYFANGGSCHLRGQLDMDMDALSVDWRISMATARGIVGPEKVLAGNIDPTFLYSNEEAIVKEIERCIKEANGRHVLNLGHGIEQDMSENAVEIFVNAAKNCMTKTI